MALPSGVWVGIAIGLFGIGFWIAGLVAFHYLEKRYRGNQPTDSE